MSVQLVKKSGSVVDIVNAARVSFGKNISEMREADWKLIDYLWRNHHSSPFRHIHFTFHIKAPIFVLRQWMKHQVGCSWNEISGRYVQFDCNFFSPNSWRSIPEKNIKQGSGSDLKINDQLEADRIYRDALDHVFKSYNDLLNIGVSKEQSRMILPLSLVSECYWTASFQALIHFLKQRTDEHAQNEIRQFAFSILSILKEDPELNRLMQICGL